MLTLTPLSVLARMSVLCLLTALVACGGGGSPASSTSNSGSSTTGSNGSNTASGAYDDRTAYSASPSASLNFVDENAAVTQHSITLGGESIPYTATAGHLVARAPGTGQAKASFFYVAYTANNKSAQTRPVTFFYNGGPGSDTVWLHLGSFGPKRLATGMPSTALNGQFALVDNAESLLNVSDLVFVNAIGTGYSQAIAPFSNSSFWSVDEDAAAFRDFITRYLEVNKRQASPKYLFGESYGGTRTGVLSALLETAGVHFEALILQSPALNYNDDCGLSAAAFCGVDFPSFAAIAAYFGLSPSASINSTLTLPNFMQQMREFNANTYGPTIYQVYYQNKAVPAELPDVLASHAGLSAADWRTHLSMSPVYFRTNLKPGSTLGRLDARVIVNNASPLAAGGADPSFDYIKAGFANSISAYLRNDLKYNATATYVVESNAISYWNFRHGGQQGPDVVPDLAAAMRINPALKILNINGYHDLATTFHWSEMELSRLTDRSRIFVRNYPGGHMTYLDDATRFQQYKDLMAFYGKALPIVQSSMMFTKAMGSAPPLAIEGPLPIIPAAQFLSKKPYGWRPQDLVYVAPTQGRAFEAETNQRLRSLFLSATHGQKQVTKQELRAAGLHAVVERFEEIDKGQRGTIDVDQWLNFLRGVREP